MSQRPLPSTPPSRIPVIQRSPAETQELVRDYVREARRKIEARAGITATDGAWPPPLLTGPVFPQPPSGFGTSPISSTKSPLLTADSGLRHESPISPETPGKPRFSSSTRPIAPTTAAIVSIDSPIVPKSPYFAHEDRSGSSSDSDLPLSGRREQTSTSLYPARKSSASGLLIFPYQSGPASKSSPSLLLDSPSENAASASPQTRKSPALGPPPSARRGPSSAYTQLSPVTPIPEESDSGRSPLSARSPKISVAATGFSYSSQDAPETGRLPPIVVADDADPSSRQSTVRTPSGCLVVKQIDVRKRPSLTTIKSGDKLLVAERAEPLNLLPPKTPQVTRTPSMKSIPRSVSSVKSRGSEPGPAPGFFGSDAVLLETRPSQESLASLQKYAEAAAVRAGSPAPKSSTPKSPLVPSEFLNSPTHSTNNSVGRTRSIASRYSVTPKPLGSAIDIDSKPHSMDDDLSKPLPRPNPVFTVPETRASVTPLPDLIKRAMRLASNLESSYRSSSRASAPFGAEPPTEALRYGSPAGRTGSYGYNSAPKGSQVDEHSRNMIDESSPYADDQLRYSQWPHYDPHSRDHTPGYSHAYSPLRKEMRDGSPERSGRRCCGMPLWVFLLVLLVLVFLIAAAVLVPVVLIVLPKLHSSSSAAAASSSPATAPSSPSGTASPTAQCQATLACANGGTTIVTAAGACRCLCVNGFTGPTCAQAGGNSCATAAQTAGDAALAHASLGAAIPRLLAAAQSTFAIPLAPATLLAVFATTGLSCNTENALVTFNVPASSATATTAPQAYANATALDFGRVCVLFVLQTLADLGGAATAQDALQSFFEDPGAAGVDAYNVNLGADFTVDVVDRVLSRAGEVVGGPGS